MPTKSALFILFLTSLASLIRFVENSKFDEFVAFDIKNEDEIHMKIYTGKVKNFYTIS